MRPPLDQRRRSLKAVEAFAAFGAGGFGIAVGSYVASWEAALVWDQFSASSFTEVVTVGMPFIGVAATAYGCGFAWAYLSAALLFSASVAAISVWRLGRVPAACLAGTLVTCPAIVFAQVRVFGITFDPIAETDADALTATTVVLRFSPLLVPASVGAWLFVRKRTAAWHASRDAMSLESHRDRAEPP